MSKQCEHYNIQINRTIKIQHTSDVSVTWDEGYIESFHLNWNKTSFCLGALNITNPDAHVGWFTIPLS